MVFNSLTFAVFFALVLALHAMPLPWRTKKFNLLIASPLFYALEAAVSPRRCLQSQALGKRIESWIRAQRVPACVGLQEGQAYVALLVGAIQHVQRLIGIAQGVVQHSQGGGGHIARRTGMCVPIRFGR